MASGGAESGVRRGTGREREDWFEVLDAWGGAAQPYGEIAGWLRDEHGLSAWWAQKLTVEYQQARGTRPPGIRRDGTFEVTGSKAIAASRDRVYVAVVDPASRAAWLPGVVIVERAAKPDVQVRFDWGDAGERVTVSLEAAAPDRTTVAVQHSRLPDEAAAAAEKEAWRNRLAALKSVVEG